MALIAALAPKGPSCPGLTAPSGAVAVRARRGPSGSTFADPALAGQIAARWHPSRPCAVQPWARTRWAVCAGWASCFCLRHLAQDGLGPCCPSRRGRPRKAGGLGAAMGAADPTPAGRPQAGEAAATAPRPWNSWRRPAAAFRDPAPPRQPGANGRPEIKGKRLATASQRVTAPGWHR